MIHLEPSSATEPSPRLDPTHVVVTRILPSRRCTSQGNCLSVSSGTDKYWFAAGRHGMCLVIFIVLSISTLLTLFMVPAMYMFIGSTHHQEAE
jgi:hypothetical protein